VRDAEVATRITRKLGSEAGNATHFVVFDACRTTLKLGKPGNAGIDAVLRCPQCSSQALWPNLTIEPISGRKRLGSFSPQWG
jgi:hypothetical protein